MAYVYFLKLKEVPSSASWCLAKSDLHPVAYAQTAQIMAFKGSTEKLQTEMAHDGKITNLVKVL